VGYLVLCVLKVNDKVEREEGHGPDVAQKGVWLYVKKK